MTPEVELKRNIAEMLESLLLIYRCCNDQEVLQKIHDRLARIWDLFPDKEK